MPRRRRRRVKMPKPGTHQTALRAKTTYSAATGPRCPSCTPPRPGRPAEILLFKIVRAVGGLASRVFAAIALACWLSLAITVVTVFLIPEHRGELA